MADHATRVAESMYCHACHHQWQREGESIECPACMSASTEIITPENDPRHFHARNAPDASASNTPSAPVPSPAQGSDIASTRASAPSEASGSNTQNPGPAANQTNGGSPHPSSGPRVTFRFATADIPVTFFTFVTTPVHPPQPGQTSTQTTPAGTQAPRSEPPPAQGPSPQAHGSSPQGPSTHGPSAQVPPLHTPPPVTFFGMHFFSPFVVFPVPPPPTANNSPPSEAEHSTQPSQQPTGQQQQQQQSQPQPAQAGPQPAHAPPHPAFPPGLLASILNSFFNPSGAVFGDAVYTQEAFDRIMTQLREQTAPGGAPPASQAALDRLQRTGMKTLDEQLLGGESKSKCVICVDDLAVGDRAAVLPCNHFFHGECVTPWLKQHNTCPVCRRSVEVEEDGPKVGKGAVDAGAERGGAPPNTTHHQPPTATEGSEAVDGMDCS